jgi:hypothetical protein
MTGPPAVADPGELDVSCLDCRHNTTVPVAALLPAAPCGRRLSRSELYQIISAVVVSPSGWREALALELAGPLCVAGPPEPEPLNVSSADRGPAVRAVGRCDGQATALRLRGSIACFMRCRPRPRERSCPFVGHSIASYSFLKSSGLTLPIWPLILSPSPTTKPGTPLSLATSAVN